MTGIYVGTNLYAWTDYSFKYYTKTPNPQVGDVIYDENGFETGKVITSVSSNQISFDGPVYITAIYNSSGTEYNPRTLVSVSNSQFSGASSWNSSVSGDLMFDSVSSVGTSGFRNAFSNNILITSVSFPALTQVSSEYWAREMFSGCTALKSVNLNNLTSITSSNGCQEMFSGCTAIERINKYIGDVNIGSLSTVNADYGCQDV